MKKTLLLSGSALILTFGTVSAQCVQLFNQGFESGTFALPWVAGAGYTNTIPSVSAPSGTFNLMASGTSGFYVGNYATFTSGQPIYMSWWMRTDVTNAANGYVVVGDANIVSDNGVVFCYFNATSGLRFFNTTGYNHPITANTWYHVEARNMNWTTRTMDIYINNALILTGWAFRSPTATAVDRVHLFNLSASNAEYDEFIIGNPAVVTTSSFTSPSCFGYSDGSATVTVTSGTAPYTYSWAPSGGTNATELGLPAGTYTCTVTDANGCTNATVVTVTEPAAITATTMQTNVSCNGGTNGDAMVMVSGGTPTYTYSWSPSGGNGAMATGLTAGSYTCDVTDANGCTTSATFNITEPSQPLMTAAANNGNVCPGDTAMLIGTAMGGTMNYTYNWMPGNMSGSVASDVPSGPTTYTLLVTDANGCTDTSTTTVLVNTPPTVNLGPDTIVCGGIILDAQNAGGTYLWSDNSTQQVLSVTVGGVYAVTVTDINGCSSIDSVVVSMVTAPSGGIISCSGGNDVCPGDSINLLSVGESGNLDWWVMLVAAPFWQQVGSGNPFNHVPPTLADTGTYQFMAIASNGMCPDDTSNIITVTVHVPPVVLLSDTAACGNSVILDAGNSGANYLWNDNSTQQQLSANASGMYSVVVTDQYGCVGSDTANVTINQNPVVTGMASSMTPCLDDADVTLTGLPAPGTWSGSSVTGNMFDPSIGAGPQIVTYTHTDTNGCSGIYNLTINVNACVGIEENAASGYSVYPNPNNGTFNLVTNSSSETFTIEITDLQGRVVYTSRLNNVQTGTTIQIDLNTETNGTYFMRTITDAQQGVQKIIINK